MFNKTSGPGDDPNGAEPCNLKTCQTEDCDCSVDGTRIPRGLNVDEVPQMITITFTGAVNKDSFVAYDKIFQQNLKNSGNDCSVKATFFVSHPYTNYSAVEDLQRRGYEIALNSISNNKNSSYWSNLPIEDYRSEFEDQQIILEQLANINFDKIFGMRVPNGRVGGNAQFWMMYNSSIAYDSSIAAPRGPMPLWPYNLEHRMPHKCLGIDQKCPSQSIPVWEMVLNELYIREEVLTIGDHTFEDHRTGCHYIDSCNINDPQEFIQFLDTNLNYHSSTNRAPFGIHFTAAYFVTRPKHLELFKSWVNKISQKKDHFFVTMSEVLFWMSDKAPLSSINTYEGFKSQCEWNEPACSIPNPCYQRVGRLFPKQDTMTLHTCHTCPVKYPWLNNPYGDSYDVYNQLK